MLTSVTVLILLGASWPSTSHSGCADVGTWTSTCHASIREHAVELSGLGVKDGQAPLVAEAGSHSRQSQRQGAPQDCGPLNRCDDFTVSLLPQATIADVASFAPQPSALTSDPAGYAVVGLPVDFAVSASAHSASGTLFDLPVTVRFTPEEIVLTPGDGSALTAPTATSHIYRDRGTYVASATVRYRAEVDFGRGWRPVPGTLDIPTAGYAVQVLEARGALVQRTCTEPPVGPGC